MAERTAERPGSLVETHKGYNPRIIFFYFVVGALLLVLTGGLAYRQLIQRNIYRDAEKQQNQRRILVPGPRGNIYDRNLNLLVGNRPRFAVTLSLDELGQEFYREFLRVRRNYRELGDKDLPSERQLREIARYSIVQKYLDQINLALGRNEKVDPKDLDNHFKQALLLPYVLLADLKPEEYAKLIEQLPVASPLQVYTSSTRSYPYGSAAAHTLGYVGAAEDIDAEEFPGRELTTQKMKGTVGKAGLEARFDNLLQGEPGGAIYRVSPSGFRIEPALERRLPVQGKNLVTSLDIDLQLTAEKALADQTGAAVAIDVKTGEVLVLASKPDYDLNNFAPSVSSATIADINEREAWTNRAIQASCAPGSTFKIVVATAGLLSGAIDPVLDTADCEGSLRIGGRNFTCDNGEGHHGVVSLSEAIAKSCDVFFYYFGMQTTIDKIAEQARRFHLDQPTGIELPGEARRNLLIPDPAWKKTSRHEDWFPGDTANTSIGQGFILVTPLQMACFAASFARGETYTVPTLVHSPTPKLQHTEPIGLTAIQRATILEGMAGCVTHGTAAAELGLPAYQIPGVRIAGKTGTAQLPGKLNMAWFICFAPIENPEIAVAVSVLGDTPGEAYQGGRFAAPVAVDILKKYFEKKQHPTPSVGNVAIKE